MEAVTESADCLSERGRSLLTGSQTVRVLTEVMAVDPECTSLAVGSE